MRLFGSSAANAKWPLYFGTSPWFHNQSPALLVIRAFLMLVFVAHYMFYANRNWMEGYWLIYLTNWSISMETLYISFATYTTYAAQSRLGVFGGEVETEPLEEGAYCQLPGFVRATWVCYMVAMPASLAVACLFWTMVNPFWAPNMDFSAMPPTDAYLIVFVHGINAILCGIDLLIGRNVYYLEYSFLFWLYAFCFLTWSIIHHVLRIGVYHTQHWECWYRYPDARDCPIYMALNWDDAGPTGAVAAVVLLVGVPLFHGFLWLVVYCRRAVDHHLEAHSEGSAREPGLEMQGRDANPAAPSNWT